MKATTSAHQFLRGLHALSAFTNDAIDVWIEHEAKTPRIRLTAIIGSPAVDPASPTGRPAPGLSPGSAWVTTTVDAQIKGHPPSTPTAFYHRLAHVLPPVASAGELDVTLSRMEGLNGLRPHDQLEIIMGDYRLNVRSSPKPLPPHGLDLSSMRPNLVSRGDILAAAVGRAADWCMQDEDRFHLTGVVIEPDGDETAVIGCDGHRMLVQRVKAPWPFGPISIHHRVARALAAYLPDAEVTMGLITMPLPPPEARDPMKAGPRCPSAHLLLEIESPLHGHLSLVVKTLDITFPPWRAVAVQQPNAYAYTIGRARLLRASSLGPTIEKKVAYMPHGGKLHEAGEDLLLTLSLLHEQLDSYDNTVTDSLGRFGSRGQVPVGIEPKYLHQACEAMGDQYTGPSVVTLLLAGQLDPILLDGVRIESLEPGAPETRVRAVIMPRRL